MLHRRRNLRGWLLSVVQAQFGVYKGKDWAGDVSGEVEGEEEF